MIYEFLALTLLLLAAVVYFTVLKPYLVYRKYKNLLPALGYKTFVHPFRSLSSSIR
jgi:hypothetical protein